MKITQAQLALALAPWYGKQVTVPQFVTAVIASLGIEIEPYTLIQNPSTDKTKASGSFRNMDEALNWAADAFEVHSKLLQEKKPTDKAEPVIP